MKFIISLLSKAKSANTNSDISVEFNNSNCKCIQQELDISETSYGDMAPYTNAKIALKAASKKAMMARYKSDEQRDLFESF